MYFLYLYETDLFKIRESNVSSVIFVSEYITFITEKVAKYQKYQNFPNLLLPMRSRENDCTTCQQLTYTNNKQQKRSLCINLFILQWPFSTFQLTEIVIPVFQLHLFSADFSELFYYLYMQLLRFTYFWRPADSVIVCSDIIT